MKKVITISREFGSGGRTIGKEIANELGYAFYDKDLIEKIAEESGLSREYIETHGEHAPGRTYFGYAFVGRDSSGNSVGDYLWKVQRDIIEDLAEKGNCVIVGRCADYILRKRTDCLHVFIHADEQKKKERIVTLYGETGDSPEKRLKAKNKTRAMNYEYYTDRTWGMASNYHVSLDSGALGEDRCVELIVGLAKLEKSALIIRTENPDDRRTTDITLTEQGKKIAEEALAQRKTRHEKMFSCLTEEEKATLLPLLEKLNASWQELCKNMEDHPCSSHGHGHGHSHRHGHEHHNERESG